MDQARSVTATFDDTGLDFYTVIPCRVIDTRVTGVPLTSGVATVFPVTGTCGVPATAKAVSVNVTALVAPSTGRITLYRGDAITAPTTSSINFPGLLTLANNAIVSLGGDGTMSGLAVLSGGGTIDMAVDVNGFRMRSLMVSAAPLPDPPRGGAPTGMWEGLTRRWKRRPRRWHGRREEQQPSFLALAALHVATNNAGEVTHPRHRHGQRVYSATPSVQVATRALKSRRRRSTLRRRRVNLRREALLCDAERRLCDARGCLRRRDPSASRLEGCLRRRRVSRRRLMLGWRRLPLPVRSVLRGNTLRGA